MAKAKCKTCNGYGVMLPVIVHEVDSKNNPVSSNAGPKILCPSCCAGAPDIDRSTVYPIGGKRRDIKAMVETTRAMRSGPVYYKTENRKRMEALFVTDAAIEKSVTKILKQERAK